MLLASLAPQAAFAAPQGAAPRCGSTRKAHWPAGSNMRSKRLKVCSSTPIAPAAAQRDAPIAQQQPGWMVGSPPPPGTTAWGGHACGPTAATPVSFEVLHCQLAHGDHLRVVGSCPALGAWQVGAAPALEWRQGHRWAGTLALPAGTHSFKLVVVRADGSTAWEAGTDRALRIPDMAGAPAGAAPLLAVTCARFGGTEETALEVDRTRLQAVADEAAARVADLARRKAELAAKLAGLEAEVLQREYRIASAAADAQRAADADLARQHVHRRQRAERLEVAAAAAELRSAAGALCAPAAQLAAAASCAISGAAAASAEGLATVLAGNDGSLQFCFSGASAGQASSVQPTALELARSRLTAQLPAATAAALERRLGSTGAAHGRSYDSAGVAALATSGAAVASGGAAVPKQQRLARQVNLLRQEVAAGAKHISDLSEQLDMLLTLGSRRRGSASGRSSTSASAHRAASLSAAAPVRVPHSGAPAAASKAVHTAFASADAPKHSSRAAASGGGTSRSLATSTASAVPHASPAPAAPAFSEELLPTDAFTRPSFPIAAAVVAAEAIVAAGAVIWSWGGRALPRPARVAAGAAFWLGCGLAALPLVY